MSGRCDAGAAAQRMQAIHSYLDPSHHREPSTASLEGDYLDYLPRNTKLDWPPHNRPIIFLSERRWR
jgi:hypothetical protein